jgi:hypothetical protein
MNWRPFVIVLLAAGLACKRPEEAPQVVRVEVPVPVSCPEPPVVERPRLPIADLTPETSQQDANRMVAASFKLLMGYARELEAVLQGYRKPAPKDNPKTEGK